MSYLDIKDRVELYVFPDPEQVHDTFEMADNGTPSLVAAVDANPRIGAPISVSITEL